MCQTCDKLQKDIARAAAEENWDKAEVLKVVLDGHISNTCPDYRKPVVTWQNGVTWKVRVN